MQRGPTNLQQMLLNNLHVAQSTYSQQQQHHTAGKPIALGPLFPLGAVQHDLFDAPMYVMLSNARGLQLVHYAEISYLVSIQQHPAVFFHDTITHEQAQSISGINASWLLRLLGIGTNPRQSTASVHPHGHCDC